MDEQTISLQDLLESPLDFSSLQLPTSSGASSESDEGWDWPTRQRKCLIAGLSGRGDRVALEITRRATLKAEQRNSRKIGAGGRECCENSGERT